MNAGGASSRTQTRCTNQGWKAFIRQGVATAYHQLTGAQQGMTPSPMVSFLRDSPGLGAFSQRTTKFAPLRENKGAACVACEVPKHRSQLGQPFKQNLLYDTFGKSRDLSSVETLVQRDSVFSYESRVKQVSLQSWKLWRRLTWSLTPSTT